jgi:hypothetical protein
MPGANGAGNVTITVVASGAVTSSRCPAGVMLSPSWLPGASYATAKENRTSAEVKGAPSENITPFRSFSVCERPSGEASQRSASAGSSASVTRLTRTRRACVSSATTSAAALASK